MTSATELAYLMLRAETHGLRLACQAVQPKSIGTAGSPAYRRLLRDLQAAEKRCSEAWSGLSAGQREAVMAAERRASSVIL